MKRLTRLLRRSLISDPHLWIAFSAAAIFLLMDFLHALKWLSWQAPPEGLLVVITFCILTLLGDRLWEREQVRERVQRHTEKLERIAQSLFDRRVALRRRPSEPDEYAYLWGGYSGIYRAYNPSYRVDKNVGEDEIVKIFVHRYQNPQFKEARYLFLTKDGDGKDALKTFCELIRLVKNAYPEVVKKIKVREMKNKRAGSAPGMFLGERHGEKRGVMELKEPLVGSQHCMPNFYLVIEDEELINHYIKNYFEPAWNDHNAMDVDIFCE